MSVKRLGVARTRRSRASVRYRAAAATAAAAGLRRGARRKRKRDDARSLRPSCVGDAGRTADSAATTTRSTVRTRRLYRQRTSRRHRRLCSLCPPTPSFCAIVVVARTPLPAWRRWIHPAAAAAAAVPVMETTRLMTDIQQPSITE